MTISKNDRIQFLKNRVNDLAAQIERNDKSKEYLDSYLASIKADPSKARMLDEVEWELLLPEEKTRNIFVHYHTMRTELLELMREADNSARKGKGAEWLDSSWVKGGTTVVTLARAAVFLYEILKDSGLFIIDSRDRK